MDTAWTHGGAKVGFGGRVFSSMVLQVVVVVVWWLVAKINIEHCWLISELLCMHQRLIVVVDGWCTARRSCIALFRLFWLLWLCCVIYQIGINYGFCCVASSVGGTASSPFGKVANV